ncbi:MAG: hypothetical protein RML95_11470 [Anaerolineae bacterium]|nr:hypothetical protein [Anaerolineae bacterium]
MAQLSRLCILILLISLSTGCAERTSTLIAVTTEPSVPQMPVEECPRTALEHWLQRSSNLTQELSDVVNGNIAIQPEQAFNVINDLSAIRSALELARAPQCATAHAAALSEALNLADAYFSAYGARRATDPVGTLTRINSLLDQARALEQELMRLYSTLP